MTFLESERGYSIDIRRMVKDPEGRHLAWVYDRRGRMAILDVVSGQIIDIAGVRSNSG